MASLDKQQQQQPAAKRPPRPPAAGTASKRAKPAQLFCDPQACSSWVLCDNYEKWQRVAQEPKADKWYCSDSLDAIHSACRVPQELSNAAIDRELELAREAATKSCPA